MAVTAAVLAAFAVLFGTRRYSVSGQSEAVLYAVAVEALVKLAALVAVAGFAVPVFVAQPAAARAAGLARLSARFDPAQIGSEFVVITLLAMAAIVCLPRQFYIGAIEAASPADARAARWPFIAYLAIVTLAVGPITLAGLTVLPAGSAPDLYVLDLPLAGGARGVALLVFLGGFSAATGMAVVETIALSTMISNDLIGPLLLPRLAAGRLPSLAADRELRLVAWNSRYLELFRYPAGLIRVGTPVADLIRYNAVHGECGPGEVEAHVERRLGAMRRAVSHSFKRVRPNGRVIKTVGGPMAGGGYVMCFTDITAEAEARAGLETARAELESRVIERTAQLQAANAALGRATLEKTRFLAAASHDLLQPLHAARLFTAALTGDVPPPARSLVENVDRSIAAADQLLRALLDISKLDSGGVRPVRPRFSVRALLADLVTGFAPLAAEKQLSLRLGPGDAWVETDRDLLRSVVQNFVSNALRYTDAGGVVIGVRRRGGHARIEVRDTGIGIAPADQQRIFAEFERLGTGSETGLGLGLAIAQRTAALLEAPIDLWSVPGRGSRFAVSLPMIAAGVAKVAAPAPRRSPVLGTLAGRRVLVVDDDAAIRDGSAALLAQWGCTAVSAASAGAALAAAADCDVALVDLDLGAGGDGLVLIARLRSHRPGLA